MEEVGGGWRQLQLMNPWREKERASYMKGKYSASLIMFCPTSNFLFHSIHPTETIAIATGHRHTWLCESEISLCIFMKLNGYAFTEKHG